MRFIDVSLSLFLAASTGPLDFNHNDRRDRNGPSVLRDIMPGSAHTGTHQISGLFIAR